MEIRRYGLEQEVALLSRKLGIPVATTFMGKGLLAGQPVDFRGTYMGIAVSAGVKLPTYAGLKFPSLWMVAGHYDLPNFTPLRMLSVWFQPESAFNDLDKLDYAALDRAFGDDTCFQLIDISLARGLMSDTLTRFVEGIKRMRKSN